MCKHFSRLCMCGSLYLLCCVCSVSVSVCLSAFSLCIPFLCICVCACVRTCVCVRAYLFSWVCSEAARRTEDSRSRTSLFLLQWRRSLHTHKHQEHEETRQEERL